MERGNNIKYIKYLIKLRSKQVNTFHSATDEYTINDNFLTNFCF